jgi:CRP/FNR family transcriptional regulator
MNIDELDRAWREVLLAQARQAATARNDHLFTPGDPARFVYFVLAGRVKIVRSLSSGAETIVGIRKPGDIVGEFDWMPAHGRHETTASVLDPGKVAILEATTFERLLLADVLLAGAFARGLARRLDALEIELTELAGKSVPGRLVDLLGRLGYEHGVREPDGTLRIGINLTHQDLADLIGTSRETLTRELNVLADVGLLRVAPRSIVLVQPRAFPNASAAAGSRDGNRLPLGTQVDPRAAREPDQEHRQRDRDERAEDRQEE